MRKIKKGIFGKSCLTLFVSKREKNAHFRAHYLFWPKFLGTKTVKPGKTKIVQNLNNTFSLKKVFFYMGENRVLLTLFLKSCVLLKTLLL